MLSAKIGTNNGGVLRGIPSVYTQVMMGILNRVMKLTVRIYPITYIFISILSHTT